MRQLQAHQPESTPSLDEVLSIVDRRRHTRQRVAFRATTVAFAGVALGVGVTAANNTSTTDSVAPTSIPVADGTEPAMATASSSPTTTNPAPAPTRTCTSTVDDVAAAMAAGLDEYTSSTPITFDEATSIANEWNIDILDVKALAGIAHSGGDTLSLDRVLAATSDWLTADTEVGELRSLASEWEVDEATVKVLASLGVPDCDR